jgi:hypothetical protein
VGVHEDTRRLRRLLRPVEQLHPETGQRILVSRAKVLYATISRQGTRWFVSLNVQAPIYIQGDATRGVPAVGTAVGSASTAALACLP